ncbi:MAG TPA: hypothetical protein PLD20_16510 [Blastocatellia bacterium]|nr:hypothetical protein [Blastocatellia bacterium]HMZ19541.1 hypothetical protein [Blastocatellia bacterium]HNG28748.1 hypothetical protein [Blastocatellia bacterium]
MKKDRPFGMWILAIADGLFSGALPLIFAVILFQNPEGNQSLVSLIVTVLLCGSIAAASIGTLCRDNSSRYLLLALITVYWSLRLFNGLATINSGSVAGSQIGLVYGDLWRAPFWIGLNWWYWLRKQTAVVFQQG